MDCVVGVVGVDEFGGELVEVRCVEDDVVGCV